MCALEKHALNERDNRKMDINIGTQAQTVISETINTVVAPLESSRRDAFLKGYQRQYLQWCENCTYDWGNQYTSMMNRVVRMVMTGMYVVLQFLGS